MKKFSLKYNLNNIIKNFKKFGIKRPKENTTYLNTFTVRKNKKYMKNFLTPIKNINKLIK